MPETIIIGAGLTGLATAHYLKGEYRVLESSATAGGLCGSVKAGGFTFDYSGHFLHLRDPRVIRLVRGLLGPRMEKVSRKAAVFTFGRLMPYPFQANLYYLPADIRERCLRGFIDRPRGAGKGDFYHWSLSTFGDGITRYFMKPYNEKLWTVPASRLWSDWCAPFVPRPTLRELKKGAEAPNPRDFGYNVHFLYPKRGGCQAIVDAFAGPVRSRISFGSACARLYPGKKYLVTSKGEKLYYDNLVSTAPLPELLKRCDGLPSNIRAAAAKLDWNSVACLNLGFASSGETAEGCHWLYFPEKKYAFYRTGIYTNVNPAMAPRGRTSMYVEISRRPGTRLNARHSLLRTLEGLADARLVEPGARPEVVSIQDIPYAYVIYDRYRQAALAVIREYLKANGIFSIGRYGSWEYSFMERSVVQGMETAALINEGK